MYIYIERETEREREKQDNYLDSLYLALNIISFLNCVVIDLLLYSNIIFSLVEYNMHSFLFLL